MSNIFEIISGSKDSEDSAAAFSLGIKMKIGKIETICPVTEFLSIDDLESEINSLKSELSEIQIKLESFNKGSDKLGIPGIDEASSPEEIWEILSNVVDNPLFIEHFNNFSEFKRRELADYIFGNCNTFTGKGAFFSAHYDQETALLAG